MGWHRHIFVHRNYLYFLYVRVFFFVLADHLFPSQLKEEPKKEKITKGMSGGDLW